VTTGKLSAANRQRYLFSGLTKCGVCGAGFIMGCANRVSCFGARDQGTCSNKLTIRRDDVEARVLGALQDKLLRQDLFEEFCDEFTGEKNRLRIEHRASLSMAERELERVQADSHRRASRDAGNPKRKGLASGGQHVAADRNRDARHRMERSRGIGPRLGVLFARRQHGAVSAASAGH
jgi:hypothetical protein